MLANNLQYFARNVLRIEAKGGGLLPFVFNRAQEYIHERLEDQLKKTGRVRAVILKGRQQGCSTYVAARYYHQAMWNAHQSVYILSHHSSTTDGLFNMVERYRENSHGALQPDLAVDNRRQMVFTNGSKYTVSTAGSGSAGRGGTQQKFHGSEVAFYENTDQIQTGVLQSVSDAEGTEIILESTANGPGNFFYQICMDALSYSGHPGEFQLIFVPWYWQPEYAQEPPEGFRMAKDEAELADLYDLTDAQIYWRRRKIIELQDEWKFRQEYPFTVDEAFQTSGDALIPAMAVAHARKAEVSDEYAAVVMGVDPAMKGDRTAIVIRRGREIIHTVTYDEMSPMELVGVCITLMMEYNPDKVFIDAALGHGTADRLKELGYGAVVQTVHFSMKPGIPRYLNKRAEMALAVKEWFEDGPVSIPDCNTFAADILSIPMFKQNSNSLIFIEPKDKIKKVLGKSPDLFDALMLTFAFPVVSDWRGKGLHDFTSHNREKRNPRPSRAASSTMRRFRKKGRGA